MLDSSVKSASRAVSDRQAPPKVNQVLAAPSKRLRLLSAAPSLPPESRDLFDRQTKRWAGGSCVCPRGALHVSQQSSWAGQSTESLDHLAAAALEDGNIDP